jgi:hypothetical protein
MADINVEEVLKQLTLAEKVDLLAGKLRNVVPCDAFQSRTVSDEINLQESTFGTQRPCPSMACLRSV